jgi:hypothetical protein
MRWDTSDPESESRFHLMLLEIQRLAVPANNKAAPRATQVYFFGSYAPTLLKLMTDAERDSMAWKLACAYLEGIAANAERYSRLKGSGQSQFWR